MQHSYTGNESSLRDSKGMRSGGAWLQQRALPGRCSDGGRCHKQRLSSGGFIIDGVVFGIVILMLFLAAACII